MNSSQDKKINVALVVSHPIQHFCPAYVNWGKIDQINFKVFFVSSLGYKPYKDKNFGKEIVWDNLSIDEFQHYFQTNEAIKVSKK